MGPAHDKVAARIDDELGAARDLEPTAGAEHRLDRPAGVDRVSAGDVLNGDRAALEAERPAAGALSHEHDQLAVGSQAQLRLRPGQREQAVRQLPRHGVLDGRKPVPGMLHA